MSETEPMSVDDSSQTEPLEAGKQATEEQINVEASEETTESSVSEDMFSDEQTAQSIDLRNDLANSSNDDEREQDESASDPSKVTANTQVQEEMPFALVNGEEFKEMPKDLYIPPDALEVFLEAFEGPLDLLLYLIRRQNLDITNIPIANITEQYMEYVELMKNLNLELAAEYLVMASVLCEIKSRVLLPRPKLDEEEEIDPRADLIRRLQEYERFKKAAEDIDEMPRVARDVFAASAHAPELNLVRPQPDVDLKDILLAFKDVLKRADMFSSHHIQRETLSVREKMTNVLAILSAESFTDFITLFNVDEGKMGVVVTFLAIMELSKESLVELVQTEAYGPIHVRARTE